MCLTEFVIVTVVEAVELKVSADAVVAASVAVRKESTHRASPTTNPSVK